MKRTYDPEDRVVQYTWGQLQPNYLGFYDTQSEIEQIPVTYLITIFAL